MIEDIVIVDSPDDLFQALLPNPPSSYLLPCCYGLLFWPHWQQLLLSPRWLFVIYLLLQFVTDHSICCSPVGYCLPLLILTPIGGIMYCPDDPCYSPLTGRRTGCLLVVPHYDTCCRTLFIRWTPIDLTGCPHLLPLLLLLTPVTPVVFPLFPSTFIDCCYWWENCLTGGCCSWIVLLLTWRWLIYYGDWPDCGLHCCCWWW